MDRCDRPTLLQPQVWVDPCPSSCFTVKWKEASSPHHLTIYHHISPQDFNNLLKDEVPPELPYGHPGHPPSFTGQRLRDFLKGAHHEAILPRHLVGEGDGDGIFVIQKYLDIYEYKYSCGYMYISEYKEYLNTKIQFHIYIYKYRIV